MIGITIRTLLAFSLTLLYCGASGQNVGVVLSGGGATALAHVGFLKALEENEIPIDFICGTSMGSVVAAMYASGYSVAEIDSFVRTEEFYKMVTGELNEDYSFYFKQPDMDASIGTIKYSKGTFITSTLPTNLIDPVQMDWHLMTNFAQADEASNYQFDSLMIPFRCIAANVKDKQQVIFRNGPLNVAVRASSTYPFYLPPRRVDGMLLFDGGIYDNFPVSMLYSEFMPDVIIGCNVSGEGVDPMEGDIISQIQSMILFRNNTIDVCEELIIVEPNTERIGTFDFESGEEAIDLGYRTTLDSMSIILQSVQRRVSKEDRSRLRNSFKERFKPLIVGDVQIIGLKKTQDYYVKQMIGRKKMLVPLADLRTAYFRLFYDDKIKTIFPILKYRKENSDFSLSLDVERERDLFISFGGNFSSRSINTGFVGLRYNLFGRSSATLSANSYFGRFYASLHGDVRWDFPGSFPFSLHASFTQNRWDFYKSLATFFDDVKPSFILMNERSATFGMAMPIGNKGKLVANTSYLYSFDEYYQTQNFLSVDTADRTTFDAFVFKSFYERTSLNRPQFASKGTHTLLSVRYMNGLEQTYAGSTTPLKDTIRSFHDWWTFKLHYTNYFLNKKKVHVGFMVEHVLSSQPFFNNYISSLIMAPAFQPIPESMTYFLPQFRAFNYSAGGLMTVVEVTKNVDWRLEGYGFGAYSSIISDENNRALYRGEWEPLWMGSSSLVFHSPLGPVSISANYYDRKEKPWSVLFNFGYIVFNRSPRQ